MSTPLTLVALLLVITVLSLRVSQLRLRHRVSLGDGGHKDLLVAVRAHGNGLEQGSLYAVLLLAHAQLHLGPDAWVLVANAAFVAARVVQPLALFGRWLRLRQLAHLASVALQWVVAVRLLLGVP
ncbi:MAG: MAPEG family protein [Hydrogenophaga sp.]